MKSIPNLPFKIKLHPADAAPADAAALLRLTLSQPPLRHDGSPAGFDFATMRARSRVADAIDQASPGGSIEFEDADFVTARQCVEAFRWGSSHPDLLKFAELFGL